MWSKLTDIQPNEKRQSAIAFTSLFVFMCAHALLETARDALFLTRLSADRLPIVYIAVAVMSLIIMGLQNRLKAHTGGALSTWIVISALVTVGFVPLVERSATWPLYALYVWPGVIVTIVLTRFFILLGQHFTSVQAKRLYPFIGAGSVSGAVAGSALAGVMASSMPAKALLVAGATVYAVGAVGPLLLAQAPLPKAVPPPPERMRDTARYVVGSRYARRIAGITILSTVVFTLADFVFKSELLAHEPDNLGLFFAQLYLVLNLLSFVVQLFLVKRLLRWVNVSGALGFLPVLMLLGGSGIAAGGGLIAALLLKGADGGLRHSLHRTASELLFVPMEEPLRSSAKTFIGVVGQRGAQGVTSILILGAVALETTTVMYGFLISAFSALWIYGVFAIRRTYSV